jgi:arylformamidase
MSDGNVDGADWIDVTVPIRNGMPHWPGDPDVRVIRVADIERGDTATVSRLDLGAHTGTHVDAPLHFLRGGGAVHELPWSGLIGPARVVHLPETRIIDGPTVDGLGIAAGERIVFRTRNSERCWKTDDFVPDYTYVSLDGARRLVERGARSVAVDYLSVGGGNDGVATHQSLLGAGVCVIEGLDLSAVAPGPYDLICLPLRVHGADGAPARVLLRPR